MSINNKMSKWNLDKLNPGEARLVEDFEGILEAPYFHSSRFLKMCVKFIY